MDNKIQNIVLKSITIILIGIGVLMTVWVMRDDNPTNMKKEEHKQWAIKKAKKLNKDKKLTADDLNIWIDKQTDEIVKEKEQILINDVSNVIDYTSVLLLISFILVVASFGYLFFIDYKKALKILAGVSALVLFVIISYYTASDKVPECIKAMDSDVICAKDFKFTSGNWKIASMAVTSSLLLICVTVLAWISGSVMKYFR